MQELQLLNEKLNLLLKKYTALQAENKRLRATVSEQTTSIDKLNKKLSGLEEGLVANHIGSSMNDIQKTGMRKQLDTVINEIDKILNTLND